MNKSIYKVVDLFGNEDIRFTKKDNRKKDLFSDHDQFVEKFEAKKTTDDCYTPKEVFKIVLDYVNEKCDINGLEIIRPFFPGGDFESIEYPDNCVVIDNPPFSIISKIAKFYISRGIRFFLFAPHLTLFSSDIDCTHIVVGGSVTYENGAVVKTSFLSNMFGSIKILGDHLLLKKFVDLEEANKVNLPKYEYPDNVITVSHVQWIIDRGISISVDKKDLKHCRGLESQKAHGKAIFGSGFLMSDSSAENKVSAKKAAAEKAAAEKEQIIIWPLSEKEIQIIKSMS